MATRFYDPNNTEQQRLLRAAQNGDIESRKFTDTTGRSGFETIDGDMRMRRYDSGQTHFEQRGPGGEWRAFGPTTDPSLLQNPDRTGQIAPDRTASDRLARAMVDNPGWDRLATPEQRGLAGVGSIGGAGMLQRAQESGFVVNPNDLLHERSFGTNAVLSSRARGFGGPPTAVELFGTDDQRKTAQGIYDRAREQYLMDQAGLNGLARSAAGGSEGRAAALRELEALRLQRAQAEGRTLQRDLTDRTAGAQETAAKYGMEGKIGAAKETAAGVLGAAQAQAGATKFSARQQKEVGLAQARRPVPLATQGGVSVRNPETGAWETTIPEPRPAAAGQPIRIGSQMVDRDGNVVYDADPQGFKAATDAAQAEYEAVLKNPTASPEERERARQKAEAARKAWTDSRQGGAQAGENDWM